jgi:hypothetical protein
MGLATVDEAGPPVGGWFATGPRPVIYMRKVSPGPGWLSGGPDPSPFEALIPKRLDSPALAGSKAMAYGLAITNSFS